jgi:hypothetical protein
MVNMEGKMGPKKRQHSMRAFIFSPQRVLWRRFVKRLK